MERRMQTAYEALDLNYMTVKFQVKLISLAKDWEKDCLTEQNTGFLLINTCTLDRH